jgi:hypothetical protein
MLVEPHIAIARAAPGPSVRALALLDGEVWLAAGAPSELHRLTLDGEPLAPGLPLPDVGPMPRLQPCDDGSVLWIDRDVVQLRVERGVLRAEPVAPVPAGWLMLDGSHCVAWSDGALRLRDGASEVTTAAALGLHDGRIVSAARLAQQRLALMVADAERNLLIVLELPRGHVHQRIAIEPCTVARFVPRRAHAVLLDGDKRLTVVDLRFGTVLTRHDHAARIVDFAVDAAGEHVLLLRQDEDGDALASLPYRALFRSDRQPSAESAAIETPAPPRSSSLAVLGPRRPASAPPVARSAPPVARSAPVERAARVAAVAPLPPRAPASDGPRGPVQRDGSILRAISGGAGAPRPAPDDAPKPAPPEPTVTVRQLLLDRGLSRRQVKDTLARHRLDGTEPASTLPPARRSTLLETEGPASNVASPAPAASRLQRVRLRLHRLALSLHPFDATASPGGEAPSPLRIFLGLQSPPSAAADERAELDRALAAQPSLLGPEQRLAEALVLEPLDLELLWFLVACQTSPSHCALAEAVWGTRLDDGVPLPLLHQLFERPAEVDARLATLAPLRRYGLLTARDDRFAPHGDALELLFGTGTGQRGRERDLRIQLANGDAAPLGLGRHNEQALAAWLARGARRLIVSGPEGAGVGALALRLATALAYDLIEVDARLLAETPELLATVVREAALSRRVILLRRADALFAPEVRPATRARLLATLAQEPTPLVLDVGAARNVDVLHGLGALGAAHMELETAPPNERATLWRGVLTHALPELTAERRDELVAEVQTFPIGVDHMRQALDAARAQGAAPGEAPSGGALRSACQRMVTHRLGDLAVKMESRATWDDLIVPAEVGEQISDLIEHVELASHVLDELGYGQKLAYGRGISVLLSGPSGTGKTMAALLIARHVGRELYRVDLSNVVSKYIGETEQRLSALFDEARTSGAVLLFDEADSLFGKRTEVKSSTDRYANLEVNFLLQKLEEHSGLSVLTTNAAHGLDSAFMRRIRFHIRFPEPEADAREQLWRSMIPAEAPQAAIDFALLAREHSLTGGAIRNAVLRAAFRATAAGRELTFEDLDRAAHDEANAMGRLQWSARG